MTDGGMTTAEVLAGSTTLRETAMMLDEMRSVYSGSDESARMTSIIARREQLNLEAKKRGAFAACEQRDSAQNLAFMGDASLRVRHVHREMNLVN